MTASVPSEAPRTAPNALRAPARDRTRQRFDRALARHFRAEGWTYERIALELGVSDSAIMQAVDVAYGQRQRQRRRDWQRSGTCPDCGAQTTRRSATVSSRCRSCAHRRLAKVRDGYAYCGHCHEWKPLAAFGPSSRYPNRPVRPICRACETARRLAWRAAHRERDRASERERKRRIRAAA